MGEKDLGVPLPHLGEVSELTAVVHSNGFKDLREVLAVLIMEGVHDVHHRFTGCRECGTQGRSRSFSPIVRIPQTPYLLVYQPRYHPTSGLLRRGERQSSDGWKCLCRNAFCSVACGDSLFCASTPRQFCWLDGKISFPDHVVESSGADHLRRLKQTAKLGIAAAGIQGPLVLPDLLDHPASEVVADVRFRMPVAGRSVDLVDGFPQFGGVPRSFPLGTLTSRCPSLQFVCNSGRSAAYLPGDCTKAEALLLESFDSASIFHMKMLSLLAFCGFCDTMMAVHSDCLPSVEVLW